MRSILKSLGLLVFLGATFQVNSVAFAETSASTLKLPQSALTSESEDDKWGERTAKGDVGFTVMGRRYNDAYANSRWGRLVVEFNLEARYESWLRAKLGIVQLLSSGSASYQLGVTEQGPANATLVTEANVGLSPVKGVEASAGILKINFGTVSSLLYEQNQAGGQLELKLEGSSGKISAKGTQSIPTSKAASNVIADEGTSPLLTTGTLQAELASVNTGTTLKASATHFEYTDLSSAMAADALRTGSTVSGTKDFQFAYEFRGKEYAAGLEQYFGLRQKVNLKASILKNELAPESLNTGKQWRAEYTQIFNKFEISPSFTQFRIESDAIPSPFGIGTLGYANRVGEAYGLKLNFPKQKFNLFGGYTLTTPINNAIPGGVQSTASTYQADREIYTLGAEAKYEMF